MSERLSTRVNQIEKIKYIREEESNLVFLALIFLFFFFLQFAGPLTVDWELRDNTDASGERVGGRWVAAAAAAAAASCCCTTHTRTQTRERQKKSHAPNGINIEREFFACWEIIQCLCSWLQAHTTTSDKHTHKQNTLGQPHNSKAPRKKFLLPKVSTTIANSFNEQEKNESEIFDLQFAVSNFFFFK